MLSQSWQLSNSTIRHTATMSRPFKWHVSPRLSNAIDQNCEFEKGYYELLFVLHSLHKSHLNSVCTQYVCHKKRERTGVCEMTVKRTRLVLLHFRLRRCSSSLMPSTVISHTPMRSRWSRPTEGAALWTYRKALYFRFGDLQNTSQPKAYTIIRGRTNRPGYFIDIISERIYWCILKFYFFS